MKISKRILPLLLILLLLPLSASAEGAIDMGKETTLTVYAYYDTTAIVGMELEAYRVASVDENGELTVLPDFEAYRDALDIRGENASAWRQMSQTLERYVTSQAIPPTRSLATGEGGVADFGSMEKGLYLLRADAVTQNDKVYAVSPCFVLLPAKNQKNGWNYQAEVWLKPSENPEFTQITVVKTWSDNCSPAHSHPDVTVKLWRNEELYDTVTLSKDCNWRHTWKGLSTLDTWKITEEPVEGYTQKPVTQEGYTFTITNTCNKSTKPGKLPQTGQLWWPVPVLLCAGLLCLVIGILRRRGYQDEKEG